MRVEYLKARARKERYREERHFIKHEKENTHESLEKAALLWDCRAGQARSLKTCPVIAEGAAAYAAERAASERALNAKFRRIWSSVVNIGSAPASPLETDAGAEPVLSGSDEDDGLHFTVAADGDSDDEPLQCDDSDEE